MPTLSGQSNGCPLFSFVPLSIRMVWVALKGSFGLVLPSIWRIWREPVLLGRGKMPYNEEIYCGAIIRGDLREAIAYIGQFQEKSQLYMRYRDLFELEEYIKYDLDPKLDELLLAYQQYYREIFYLRREKALSAHKLRDQLLARFGIADESVQLCDVEEKYLLPLFAEHGYQFLGGKTSGYYGPYIWSTTELVTYDVELPDGIETYDVKLLDGIVSRSWIDYLSFGMIGTGGWTDGDGYINCVRSAWDLNGEAFRVSLLKHEAQHVRDLRANRNLSPEDLEYRAKLVELIYTEERNMLRAFAEEADPISADNGHARAASRIVKEMACFLGAENLKVEEVSVCQIQAAARALFEESRSLLR